MSRQSFIALAIALICAVANAEDRRTDKTRLSIMTVNAEFLWDGIEPEEGTADFPWKGDPTAAAEHMSNIAPIILRANPDIINLVEVENSTALTAFNNNYLAGRGYVPYLVQGKDFNTGQDVALLTRIDPDDIKRDDRKGVSGSSSKTVTKHYIATMTVGNQELALIGVHFLAIPTHQGRRLDRQAQADLIATIASEQIAAGRQVIILGDMNDYDEQTPDHQDNMPITTVLQDLRSLKNNNAADDLTNVADRVPKANRYTAFYDRNENDRADGPDEFSSIDHILISPALAGMISNVDIPHEHDPASVTDHFPVIVQFSTTCNPPCTATTPSVRITSLLPNPTGSDNMNESVTLINNSTATVNLNGWRLRDLAGKHWTLNGNITGGATREFKRNGQQMALNNDGDTIDLLDNNGTVVHNVTYGDTTEGELITPAP